MMLTKCNSVLRSILTSNRPCGGRVVWRLFSEEASTHASESNEKVRKKIAVFGGSGYVGQQVVAAALNCGVDVVSINRRGAPTTQSTKAIDTSATIEWRCGDLLGDANQWDSALDGVDGVISCVGAFGSNEFMERVNGDANINAIRAATEAKVSHFVFVSTADNNLPPFVLRGYFNGKRRAEQALLDAFPTVVRDGGQVVSSGTVLRPGFIYGERQIADGVKLPLQLVGRPLEALFNCAPVPQLRNRIPGMQALLAPPIAVERVARVAVACAVGEGGAEKSVLSIDDINALYQRLQ